MTGHAALPPEDPTPPDGIPTPPTGVPAVPTGPTPVPTGPVPTVGVDEDDVATVRVATPRHLAAVPDATSPALPDAASPALPDAAPVEADPHRAVEPDLYPTVVSGPRTGAFGRPIGKHRPTALHRLVEVARVLTGGLMVLTLVVIVAPFALGAVGPGSGVMAGHVVGAVVALAATGTAAWRRTPVWAATVAALVVPIDLLVVLTVFWWR
jgi:hypothetical protein